MSIKSYVSEELFYKSVKGAVGCGETVKFKIVVPRSYSVNAAEFWMKDDETGKWSERGMYWAGMHEGDNEIWDVEIKPEKVGLFFYHFELCTPSGKLRLGKGADGTGEVDGLWKTDDWQLTVCQASFKTPDWLKGGVIYQIFPDRFCNSGKEKHNVPSDRILRSDTENTPFWEPNSEGKVLNNDYFCGDLKGVEEKIPYLTQLGVTCIYLNPIFEAHSNHRYNTADYTKIDSLLGTTEDFVSLCDKAHKNGIKIILDGVFSHTGDDSVYFNKENRYDSLGAYNSKESVYYGWYKFQNHPDKYTSWWGFETLPEVTEENEGYLEFITGENGIIRKWLRLGADGWRLDVADELPDVFIEAVRRAAKTEKEDALLLGEVWEDASNKISYGERRRFILGEQFDSVMNYPFANAVLDFARNGRAEDFVKTVNSVINNYPKQVLDVLMNHIGTHDTERAITRIVGKSCMGKDRQWQSENFLTDSEREKGIKLMKLAASLSYMLPGVPSVYYGDEIGMEGYKDPFNRAFFNWENIGCELHSFYVMLGKLRKENGCLKDGEFSCVSATLGCVAFERIGQEESLLIIANRNEEDIEYYLPEKYFAAEEVFSKEICTRSIKVPALSSVILKKLSDK